MPFTFGETINYSLVAPFFTDIDIRRINGNENGNVFYEIHNKSTSEYVLSQVNAFITGHTKSKFSGEWLLVATWDHVPPYMDNTIVSTLLMIIMNIFISLYTDKHFPGSSCNGF